MSNRRRLIKAYLLIDSGQVGMHEIAAQCRMSVGFVRKIAGVRFDSLRAKHPKVAELAREYSTTGQIVWDTPLPAWNEREV